MRLCVFLMVVSVMSLLTLASAFRGRPIPEKDQNPEGIAELCAWGALESWRPQMQKECSECCLGYDGIKDWHIQELGGGVLICRCGKPSTPSTPTPSTPAYREGFPPRPIPPNVDEDGGIKWLCPLVGDDGNWDEGEGWCADCCRSFGIQDWYKEPWHDEYICRCGKPDPGSKPTQPKRKPNIGKLKLPKSDNQKPCGMVSYSWGPSMYERCAKCCSRHGFQGSQKIKFRDTGHRCRCADFDRVVLGEPAIFTLDQAFLEDGGEGGPFETPRRELGFKPRPHSPREEWW